MPTLPTDVVAVAPVEPVLHRAGWRQKAVPVLCGCAMAGAAVVVALRDPSAPGSWFPACAFHSATGLWCPGCGLTRGFHQLFHGHLASAMGYNLFVPAVLVAVVVSWWNWTRSVWGGPARRGRWRMPETRWITFGVPAVLVIYAVLRNIPAAPFSALAP